MAQEVRTLTVKWSDKLANFEYTLNTFYEYENGERELRAQTAGDKDWAERIAKHYILEMPQETK